ncbi:CPBP family intramembrane glutamic endopeptidase [Kribbella deserti]|uniref:Lysostaphin resistance A-like protein n=1 Tax=Kribbella deserti TaxID=1926257 RepID=A0ABV6QJ32_9ACTN
MRNGRWVLAVGLALIAGSAVWLFATGHTGIRYSADHDRTQPLWWRWVPVAIGLLLTRLIPPRLDRPPLEVDRRGAYLLAGAAAAFAVLLVAFGGGEPAHSVLKLLLLLALPLIAFRVWKSKIVPAPGPVLVPVVAVAAWLVVSYVGPVSVLTPFETDLQMAELLIVVAVAFLANSVLEEFFYRRWLQTRWEALIGPWPAIVLSSVLWACWHVGIQGTGDLSVDLPSALVNQGVQGLFLGYLWSRYRRMWPLIVVHGAVNTASIIVWAL